MAFSRAVARTILSASGLPHLDPAGFFGFPSSELFSPSAMLGAFFVQPYLLALFFFLVLSATNQRLWPFMVRHVFRVLYGYISILSFMLLLIVSFSLFDSFSNCLREEFHGRRPTSQ
jgi:hypothetical protein